MDPHLVEPSEKIDNALLHLQRELASIRAGRANPTLIEELPVNVYGSRMKLMEVGTINAPQPTLLTVQVWDASIIKDVEKAIMESNLGINPAVDGTTIRLPIPPLSEERREEFAKLAHQKGEVCRIAIRQIRNDQRSAWGLEEEKGEIGEDELERREKLLQDIVDRAVLKVDEFVKAKVEELRQI
jgi:ribosome recycling factor